MDQERYPGNKWDRYINLGRFLRRGLEVAGVGVLAAKAPHIPSAILIEAGVATVALQTELLLSVIKRRKIRQAEPLIFTNFRFPITFSRRAQKNALSV